MDVRVQCAALATALVACGGVLLAPERVAAAATAAAVPPREPHVLFIGIDGCRVDALEAANAPNLHRLAALGAYANDATNSLPTLSGPNWSSMLTGVGVAKHGVVDNTFAGRNFTAYPHVFERLHAAKPGLQLHSIVHWAPIDTFIVSSATTSSGGAVDALVARQAAHLLATGTPDVLFLHFDDVDHAGHASGFSPSSPAYIAAIESVDGHVGTLLRALDARRRTLPFEDWLVIVSTDHGGTGTSHGGSSAVERRTFVILNGPSVPRGVTLPPGSQIVDLVPTLLDHMRVPVAPSWSLDGTSLFQRFGCPSSFRARADLVARNVTLAWTPALLPGASTLALRRDGVLVQTLPASASTFVDAPPLAGSGHRVFTYELASAQACAPLVARAVLSTGQVAFADDFDAYADDAQLANAGWSSVRVNNPVEASDWTVTNPGARANPPLFDGRPSSGRFVISDSDHGGSSSLQDTPGSGMSHDLRSPAFSCAGLTRVWLHADCSAQLNENGSAVFDVDVSTNGGASWTNVSRRVAPGRTLSPVATIANTDGFFGRLDVDLTAFAAGQANVRVRFRHFEPSWDWWIALDDVFVDDVDTRTGGTSVLLANQNFTPGSQGLPPGWTRQGLNTGTETWHFTDKGSRYAPNVVGARRVNRIQHSATAHDFAMLDSDADPDPAEDEYLITPVLDCSAQARVWLHFRSETVLHGSAVQEVLVSFDGGATFQPERLFSYSAGGLSAPGQEPVFADRVLSVPSAAGRANVAFAFRYQSPGNAWWWAVDDVRVTGSTTP